MTSTPPRSRAPFVFFVLAFLVLALYLVAALPLRQARLLWREGKVAEARQLLENWSRLGIRPADYAEALAVIYLTAGDRQAASQQLDRMRGLDRSWWGRLDSDEVGERLVALGRYEELLVYSDALGDQEELEFFRAAALAGTGRIDAAAKLLSTIDRSEVEPRSFEALQTSIRERQNGITRLVEDRDGNPLATFRRDDRSVAANEEFAPLFEASGGVTSLASSRELNPDFVYESTLDPRIQRAAVEALGDFKGSLVAIDVSSGELLAAANTTAENLAFSGAYEPGSVMKVLTGLAAMENDIDFAAHFPYDCTGVLGIGGRRFHDWARHDHLESFDEALAVSCNLVFARLGIAVTAEKLDALWRKAGFNADANVGWGAVPLGRRQGVLAPDFAVATAACGLEFEKTNALQLAAIANAIANGGTFIEPRAVRAKRSIVGAQIKLPPPRAERIAETEHVKAMVRAMESVVTDPRGTGRRATLAGTRIAMKTGTAGQRDPAYDSLVLAFAPADKPEIAIGIVAENSGPAEFAGSIITRDFFRAVIE